MYGSGKWTGLNGLPRLMACTGVHRGRYGVLSGQKRVLEDAWTAEEIIILVVVGSKQCENHCR